MSYVKAVEGIVRLFPKKIKVRFIDFDTGELIGTCKIYAEQLPKKFKRPVIIRALEKNWRVLKANPARDYIYKRKLDLSVRDADSTNVVDGQFFFPSKVCELPELSNEYLFDDFFLELAPDEWMQFQLLPKSFLTEVREEISEVESILRPPGETGYRLWYDRVYWRNLKDWGHQNTSFDTFCSMINARKKGAVRLLPGLVKNGLAIQSDNWTYYGTVTDGNIRSLAISALDYMDFELLNILSELELILVDWCEGSVFTGEREEKEEAESINQPGDASSIL